MGFLVAVALLIIVSLAVDTVSNNSPETAPSLVEEETQAPLATPTLLPTQTPTPIPTSTPTPTPDYLSKLTKCLKENENDPLRQRLKEIEQTLTSQIAAEKEKAYAQSNPDWLQLSQTISRLQATALVEMSKIDLTLKLKYDCFGTNFSSHSDDLEKAWLIKDINSGDSVIIERRNGEQWLLEAKIWCSWCWRYEGRQILLKFGYTTSKLINDDGDVSEFWTEDEL